MRIIYSLVFVCCFLVGCQNEQDTPGSISKNSTINGVIQKGPFISGSKVTVAELDQKLNLTGKTFTTTILNDRGEFSLKDLPLSTDYVQIIVDGFFFNEIKGKLSDAQITLFAISDIKDINSINVNVLTHLEVERVKHLIQKENMTFEQAKKQALQEVLGAFYIKEELNRAESFDLTSNTKESHVLLAVSSIIINEGKEALMTQLMSKISTDIADDGILDSEIVKTQIDTSSVSLCNWYHGGYGTKPPARKIDQIRVNTIAKYKELGVDLDLTCFERYIDRNGNRDLSDNKPNQLDHIVFTPITNANKADFLYFSNEVTFDDITDSIVMWMPSYPMGYSESMQELKVYFCESSIRSPVSLNMELKEKYGVHPIYTCEPTHDYLDLNLEHLYLNNGLIVGWYDRSVNGTLVRYNCHYIPSMHVYINNTPIAADKAEVRKFTINKGDKLKVAMNPYHALYDRRIHEGFYPAATLDVPEYLFRGKTALGTIFIEGKQIDFKVSLEQ